MPRPDSWRSAGFRSSTLGTGTVFATATAAAARAAGLEGISTTAVAAVFPAPGTRSTLTASPLAVTATGLAIATSAMAIAAAAVAATAAITASATAVAAATTAGGGATGLSLVDAQGTAHQLRTLQRVDGPGFHLRIRHLHEGEAPLAPRIALKGQGAVHHLPVGRKQLCHVFLLCSEGQIADKNAHEPGRPRSRAMRAPGPLTAQA